MSQRDEKGRFVKGIIPHNLGKSPSLETIQKISESKKGCKPTTGSFSKGHVPWIKGKKHKPESLKKMSESKKGEKHNLFGKKHKPETIQKMRESHLGKKMSIESIKKMSDAKKKNPTRYWLGKKMPLEYCKKLKGRISPMKGKKHKPETIEKISNAHKGKTMSIDTRKKMKYNRQFQVFPLTDTKPERITQIALSLQNIPYKKHIPFEMPWGFHQVDIFIEPNIVLEVDGCYWHGCTECGYSNPEKTKKDQHVTTELERQGLRVFRFWEHEIKEDVKKLIDKIVL